MYLKRLCHFAVLPAFCLSACTASSDQPKNVGQRISDRGGEIAQYGASWSAGQREVDQGERLARESVDDLSRAQKNLIDARNEVSSAEENVRTAEATQRNAERMINSGQAKMQQAEDDYGAARAGPPASQVPVPD